jgi:hypothetical protein
VAGFEVPADNVAKIAEKEAFSGISTDADRDIAPA